jgi:hypothetical protein
MKWHQTGPDIIDDDPHDGNPPPPPIYYDRSVNWTS